MNKAKIVVVGPCESGKTALSNILGDQTDVLNSPYKPTAGVRILEFETLVNNENGSQVKVDVELWDCSGNEDLESCWPAMAHQSDGVIIVYDPNRTRPNPSIPTLFNFFVTNQNIKERFCLIVANFRSKDFKSMTSPVKDVPILSTNFENKSEDIQESFQNLLENILVKLSDSRNKEELSILS